MQTVSAPKTAKGFKSNPLCKMRCTNTRKGPKFSCGFIWHLCGLHNIDPSQHKPRKAPNAEKRPEQTRMEEAGKGSKRKSSRIQKPSRKKLHVHGKTPQQTPEPNRLKEAWQSIQNKGVARGIADTETKREREVNPAAENKGAETHCTQNWRLLAEHAC